MDDSIEYFRGLVSPLAGGWRHELEVCRALLSGEVLPTDDWQLTGDEFTDEALRRRRELEGHLRSARRIVSPYLSVVRGRAEELERVVADMENEREVAHRLALAEERIAAARLAACGSGWDEGVVAFVVYRINAVHDGWARRWRSDGGEVAPYPTVAEFAVEVGRWCDAYAEMLEALPPLLIAARKRREKDLEAERERAAKQERIFSEATAKADALAATVKAAVCGRKPSATLLYAQLVATMRRICGSDAVDERTLRRWVSAGRTGSGFAISHDDMLTVQSWDAWCRSYFAHESGRLRVRQSLDERRDGAVGDASARPRR